MDTPTPEETTPEMTIEVEEVVKTGGVASQVIGENIRFESGLAVNVNASESLTFTNSLGISIKAEKDMQIENSGAVSVVSGGEMHLTNGGAQVLVAGGNMSIENGGGQLLVAGGEVKAQHTFIGVAVANQISLSEDSKILLDKPRAALFGAAFGAVFALLSWLLRRGKG
jgi:hypothetical protein